MSTFTQHPPAFLAVLLAFLVGAIPKTLCAQGCPAPAPVSPPWLSYPAQPYRHVTATPQGAFAANVYLMDLEGGLGRPFVFVEGIDFGLNNVESPLQLGDFGWAAFNGCDPDGYPMMGDMPVLLDSIVQRGFHPVLVDFENGAGDIFSNAALFADILTHLRDHRNDPRPMVVSGASMGGQIARLALGSLEAQGSAHCAQLYLSLDSPHQGANIPLGLQQLIQVLTQGNVELSSLGDALLAPAARQLLLKQVYPMVTRLSYQEALDSLGWPQRSRNVGIANGGTAPLGEADTPLLDYEYAIITSDVIGDIGGLLDFEVHAFPGAAAHPMAGPFAPVTSWVEMPDGAGWPWPLDLNVGYGAPSATLWSPSIDLMPGGTRPSMQQFAAAMNTAIEALDVPWPIDIPAVAPWNYQPLHSFIPTPSALGISPPWDVSTMENLAALSPFDAVFVPDDNEPHSEVNPANLSFVLDQLDVTSCPLEPGDIAVETVLNDSGDWGLPGLSVYDRLCLQSADPVFGALAAPVGSTGEFHLFPCSGAIQVMDGGTLELGGGPAGSLSSCEMVIHPGASLTIEGQLVLHPGSKLTVLSGGTLDLSGGMVEQLEGSIIAAEIGSQIAASGSVFWAQHPHSTLFPESEIHLASGTQWSHHLGADARIRTQHQTHFHLAHESSMTLSALTDETHWILGSGAQVNISGEGSWHQEQSGLRLMGQASWRSALSEGIRFDGTQWIGAQQDSVLIEGPLSLFGHVSQSTHLAHQHGEYRIETASFVEGSSRLAHNKIRWTGAGYVDHPVVHAALGDEPAHLIEDGIFQGTHVGFEAIGPGRIRLEDTRFEGNETGLQCRNARVETACCSFLYNDIGLEAERSLLAMEPENGGGWNRFSGNGSHMRFFQAEPPLMAGGANHFEDHYFSWASGSLDLPCFGEGVDWLINGQSWNWPTSWPQIQEGLWAWDPNGDLICPVTAIDLHPISPRECGDTGKKRTD